MIPLKVRSHLSVAEWSKASFSIVLFIFIKLNTGQFLKHMAMYLHALAELATAEGFELRSLSV